MLLIRIQLMTDGRRDCIERTIASAGEMLTGPIVERVIHDDSGNPDNRRWLAGRFPEWEVIGRPTRQGFGGAIINAWRDIEHRSRAWWIMHLEDDFLFNRPVDLMAMVAVLAKHPHLAQMVLRRQAWNAQERAAGGVVEQHPDEYADLEDGIGNRWMEHRLYFSTNPCVYSAELLRAEWPTGAQSEGRFTHKLLTDGLPWGTPGADVRFGMWGHRADGPAVEHIGERRNGNGY